MIIAQACVVPMWKAVSVLGMLAKVIPKLIIAKGFIVTFGERVCETQSGESAD